MAHLLLIEVPGGNDFDLFEAAISEGHEVSFFTADQAYYQKSSAMAKYLVKAKRIIEIKPFDYAALEIKALEIHREDPFAALLCLIDIRIIEAAKLAEKLQLRFLNPQSATVIRDKYTVRTILAEQDINQPEFALATTNQALQTAVESMGLPVIVKPCDGYGSQNIATILNEEDLNLLLGIVDKYLPCKTDYGFGVQANDRLLIERYIDGQLIGCDTFSQDGQHVLLGINEKLMFAPPSMAIKGSCFPSDRYDITPIQDYLFTVLNALNFNDGVAHTEILLSKEGPLLVEVNPRLVGAKIPRLLNLALGRSVHTDVINLHLGKSLTEFKLPSHRFAVSRWITTDKIGTLEEVTLPSDLASGIRNLDILKKQGDEVSYPFQNADRIGCVMTLADTRERAEELADNFIAQVQVKVSSSNDLVTLDNAPALLNTQNCLEVA